MNRMGMLSEEVAVKLIKERSPFPRPLAMAAVKEDIPVRKTLVANLKERRQVADRTSCYTIHKLQGRCLVRRERHPVLDHHRILVYGKLHADYVHPDWYSSDPLELSCDIKYKAAFREKLDEYTPQAMIDAEIDRQRNYGGLDASRIIEGKRIESQLYESGYDPLDIPEDLWEDASLDNVVDLGFLMTNFFEQNMVRPKHDGDEKKKERKLRRARKRILKDTGQNIEVGWGQDKEEMWQNEQHIRKIERPGETLGGLDVLKRLVEGNGRQLKMATGWKDDSEHIIKRKQRARRGK